jgi:hypothetical protein
MESKTAWEKALCRLFFVASKEKANSKQSGWNIRLKKLVRLTFLGCGMSAFLLANLRTQGVQAVGR